MPPIPQSTLENPALWPSKTGESPSTIFSNLKATDSHTGKVALVALVITAGGGSLLSALLLYRRWRREIRARERAPGSLMDNGVYDMNRRDTRRKRMQKAVDDMEMGFQDAARDDRWEQSYREYRSEVFEGEAGLGVHFVDVDLRDQSRNGLPSWLAMCLLRVWLWKIGPA